MATTSRQVGDGRSLYEDLVRVETRVYNALDARLRAESALNLGQLEFLRFVGEHPRARVADIAAEFAVGIGATSKAVDRLERSGWLTRVANPDDRRSSLLVLSAAGEQVLAPAVAVFDSGTADLLVDDPDAAAAARYLARTRERLEHARAGLPTG